MFAGIYKTLVEPFINFGEEPHIAHENLRYYYGDKRPNSIMVKSEDQNIDLDNTTVTYLGSAYDTTGNNLLSRRSSALNKKNLLSTASLSNDLMAERQRQCESTNNVDSFSHLTSLAANVNARSKFRCGWVYNETTPSSGRGAYGSVDGPLNSSAKGTWMWDLNAAKKKYHFSICNGIRECNDLANDLYKGKCGFCRSSSKGVPIVGSAIAYPNDPFGGCASTNLIVSNTSCPRPPQPPAAGTPASQAYMQNPLRQKCDRLPGNKYSRDCYIDKARQAGCDDKGTLITALKAGSDTNYLDTLLMAKAYTTYQQRAEVGLSETYLKSAKLVPSDALSDFMGIKENATSAANQGLRASAADLCFISGSFEEYDFCGEILPSASVASVTLECLQNEFKRGGGQETGTLYPSANTLLFWNTLVSWNNVQDYINQLATKTRSTDRKIQEDAVNKFYGISLDRKLSSLGYIPNVEIFWFTPDTDIKNGSTTYNTTFLGRRIRDKIPLLEGFAESNNSFVYFTNIKPTRSLTVKLKFTGDSGFIFLKSGIILNTYSGNGANTTNQELSSLESTFANPASQMLTNSDWTFANTDNIITGYYLGNGKNHIMEYKLSGNIPGSPCFCEGMSRGGLRFYTESQCNSIDGKWMGKNFEEQGNKYGECLKNTPEGGSYSWDCRNVDNNTCIPMPSTGISWSEIPADILYLIQHPYAPMIKFAARPNHTNYGCDFSFCDKRLSSHKMKFAIYNNSGPQLINIPDVDKQPNPIYNMDKSYMKFTNSSGIYSKFLIKLFSFATMVFRIRFNSLPLNGIISTPIILWASYPSLDSPSIFLTGTGNNTARLSVGGRDNKSQNQSSPSAYGVISPPLSTNGPTIKTGIEYLITLKVIRTNQNDIDTVSSLQVGAASVSQLKDSPSNLVESSIVTWPNKQHLENKASNVSRFFLITADNSISFDLFSIEMYDYILSGDNLQHAAEMDWPLGPQVSNPYK